MPTFSMMSEKEIDAILPELKKIASKLDDETIKKECRKLFEEQGALVFDNKKEILKTHFTNKYKKK